MNRPRLLVLLAAFVLCETMASPARAQPNPAQGCSPAMKDPNCIKCDPIQADRCVKFRPPPPPPPKLQQVSITGVDQVRGMRIGIGLDPLDYPLCEIPYCDNIQVQPREPRANVPFTARLHGYQNFSFVLGPAVGWSKKVSDEDLKRCPTFRIGASAPDATLIIDSVEIGQIKDLPTDDAKLARLVADKLRREPTNGCLLSEREYTFDFSLSGYLRDPFKKKLLLGQPEPYEIAQPRLTRAAGSLVVVSSIGDANVMLDGKLAAVLPPAGTANIVLEIPSVDPGEHVVELQIESDYPQSELWGTFPRVHTNVRVAAQQSTQVVFVPSPLTVSQNPVRMTADRRQLEELCETDTSACLALGWAQRWGVGGPASANDAAESFAAACRRSGSDATMLQGCTAYRWLVQTGAAAPIGGAQVGDYACEPSSHFPDDPITPCVRARLSTETQVYFDPTVFVQHEPRDLSSQSILVSGGFDYGGKQRIGWAAVTAAVAAGTFAVDLQGLIGGGDLYSWDAAYERESFDRTWFVAFSLGPTFRIVPHVYGSGSIGIASDWEDTSMRLRLAAGYTFGSAYRRGFFIVVGGTMLVGSIGKPSNEEVVQSAIEANDLEQLSRAWEKNKDTASFLAGSLELGWAF